MRDLFETYCGMERTDDSGQTYSIFTKQIVVEKGVGDNIATLSQPFLGDSGKIALIVDDNTLRAAGTAVQESFRRAGRDVVTLHLEPKTGDEIIVCDDDTLVDVTAALSDAKVVGTVSIGSGTISDLGKMGSHRVRIPDVAVGTAPSNNGYTSAIAAILSDGLKTTQPCTPAVAVFADPEVMRNAPYRMIASGIGDLYSKPVSNADWRLSYRLNDSFFSPIVMEIVDAGNALLHGVAPRLPSRDFDAVANLTGSIMLSGLGMQAAGTSGPASGGEHLISHYLDMTEERDQEPHDLHGCQVAVGTVITSTLYDRLLRVSPGDIDIDACVAQLPSWPDYESLLRERFGTLAEAVVERARQGYPTAEVLRARLTRLTEGWDDIMPWVAETLRPPNDLAGELDSADCPTTFPQISVNRDRAVRAVQHCKDIRNRYTVLHLLWELNLLDEWAAEIVAEQFG